MRICSVNNINTVIMSHAHVIDRVTADILTLRPHHHGLVHARNVQKIATRLTPRDLRIYLPTIRVCALVHDVMDTKFHDDSEEWEMRLHMVPGRVRQFILDVGVLVSMSREMRHGRHDWVEKLGAGVFVRAIVSDADKLDSLFARGHQRLVEYNHEKLLARGITTHAKSYPYELVAACEHVIDTRQRLVPAYMQTSTGRRLARLGFTELVAEHNEWKKRVFART